jgi:hypothetical protein
LQETANPETEEETIKDYWRESRTRFALFIYRPASGDSSYRELNTVQKRGDIRWHSFKKNWMQFLADTFTFMLKRDDKNFPLPLS